MAAWRSILQPESLSKARPRYDHQVYGPSTPGCSPYDVHVAAVLGGEHAAEPLPLLGQEAGVLGVAAPVLQVGLLVGDVPVAADDHLAPVGGGPLAQCLQVGEELAHETVLLVLPFGADLAGGR